jgi:hypothetical protein
MSLGDAEVAEGGTSTRSHEDVLRLYVAVDDPLSV